MKNNNENLQFKNVMKKIVMLFVVLEARREQSLFTIGVDNTVVKNDKVFLLRNRM